MTIHLGTRQQNILESIIRHRGFGERCGWYWDTPRKTEITAQALAKKHAVYFDEVSQKYYAIVDKQGVPKKHLLIAEVKLSMKGTNSIGYTFNNGTDLLDVFYDINNLYEGIISLRLFDIGDL